MGMFGLRAEWQTLMSAEKKQWTAYKTFNREKVTRRFEIENTLSRYEYKFVSL